MYSRCLLLSLPAAPLTFPPHNKRAPLNALYGVKVGVLESCHLIGSEDFDIPQSHSFIHSTYFKDSEQDWIHCRSTACSNYRPFGSIYCFHGLLDNNLYSLSNISFAVVTYTVADPGLPRGGGANSPGGAPTYDFAKFSQKLHEIERIWTPGGGARVQNFTM